MILLLFTFIISLLLLFGIFLQNLLMYMWTTKLEEENCDCSNLWHRKTIKLLSIGLTCSIILRMILIKLIPNELIKKGILISSPLISIGLIFYLFIILDYIYELKKRECKCSEDWKKDYGYIFSIVYLIMLFLLPIIIVFIFLINFKNDKKIYKVILEKIKKNKKYE